MLIDVPVTIDFDAQTTGRPKSPATYTLRWDLDEIKSPVLVTNHYPPRENASWSDGSVLLDLMPAKTHNKICWAARRYPADYCADEDEGQRLQDEADEQAAADGQFGVGA